MVVAISGAWPQDHVGPHIIWLLGKLDTPPLRPALPLIFSKIIWEAGQDVVDLLLQIASVHSLLPHIPIEIWAWLKERPSLPPVCWGRESGTSRNIIRHIRGLGDIEILKSYFLVVWSEWNYLYVDRFEEMEISIREDFSGIGMKRHRKDLIVRLDYVLEQLKDTPGNEAQIRRYGWLKKLLLKVDGEQ